MHLQAILALAFSAAVALAFPLSSQSHLARRNGTDSACGYPSQAQIAGIFDKLNTNDVQGFLVSVSPAVNWTVEGTHPLAGNYLNRDVFVNATLGRLDEYSSATDPLKISIGQITGGGDCSADAVVELMVRGTMRNGLPYNNNYAWVCKFDQQGIIVQVRAYLDSELVTRAITSNEVPSYTFSASRGVDNEQFPGPLPDLTDSSL